MATPSVRIVKTFNYRGAVKEYSNRYHFTGGTPADSTAWNALFDAITAQEKTCLPAAQTITQAIGYNAGSNVPAASKAYTLAGTLTAGGGATPGECAAVVRLATTKVSTKNHTVFVFSYYHAPRCQGTGINADELMSEQETALSAYHLLWKNGITAGGVTAIRSTPDGHVATGRLVEHFISHRDFPR